MILAGFFMHLLANRRLQKSFTFDLRKVGWGPPESPLESFLGGRAWRVARHIYTGRRCLTQALGSHALSQSSRTPSHEGWLWFSNYPNQIPDKERSLGSTFFGISGEHCCNVRCVCVVREHLREIPWKSPENIDFVKPAFVKCDRLQL